MREVKQPSDKDEMKCPHCNQKFKHRSPYMYHTRLIQNVPIQIIDSWNVPYSTGIYILVKEDVPLEKIEEFADKAVHFPLWPLVYQGKLYSKNTWDD